MSIFYAFLSIALAIISMPLYEVSSSNRMVWQSPFSKSPSPRKLLSFSNITNHENYQYYLKASIGTPPQVFKFEIQINAEWSWISGDYCKYCHKGKKFIAKNSTTYHNTTEVKKFDDLEGYLSADTFSIGENNSLSATDQHFLLAYNEKHLHRDMTSDGLISFALDANRNTTSFISSLKNQDKIQNRQYAIYLNELNKDSNMAYLGKSSLIIDGYDLEKYSSEGNFTYIDLVNSSYWAINCDSIEYKSTIYDKSVKAFLQTDVNSIIGPQDSVKKIVAAIRSSPECFLSGEFTDDYCVCDGNFPQIIFTFSGLTFALEPSDYFYKNTDGCLPNFEPMDIDYWVLGKNFLRRFYINYDMDGRRIGLAKIKLGSRGEIEDEEEEEEEGNEEEEGGGKGENEEEEEDAQSCCSATLSDSDIAIIIVFSTLPGVWAAITSILLIIYFMKVYVLNPRRHFCNANPTNIEEMPRIRSNSSDPETGNNKNVEREDNEKRENANHPNLEEIEVIVESN